MSDMPPTVCPDCGSTVAYSEPVDFVPSTECIVDGKPMCPVCVLDRLTAAEAEVARLTELDVHRLRLWQEEEVRARQAEQRAEKAEAACAAMREALRYYHSDRSPDFGSRAGIALASDAGTSYAERVRALEDVVAKIRRIPGALMLDSEVTAALANLDAGIAMSAKANEPRIGNADRCRVRMYDKDSYSRYRECELPRGHWKIGGAKGGAR